MILSAQSIRCLCHKDGRVNKLVKDGLGSYKYEPLITPFFEKTVVNGKSFGLTHAGYDIRVDKFRKYSELTESVRMQNGDFVLASSMEYIQMPDDLQAIVHDKSSWAREGLALQNTVLEPGWRGYITLELSFHRPTHHININHGDPIAQLIFHKLDGPTEIPYKGKYQNQPAEPVETIHEH